MFDVLCAAGEGGVYATRAEHDRLAARLAALPTTEEQDQALLDSGNITGAPESLCHNNMLGSMRVHCRPIGGA